MTTRLVRTRATAIAARQHQLPGLYIDGARLLCSAGAYGLGRLVQTTNQSISTVGAGAYTLAAGLVGTGAIHIFCSPSAPLTLLPKTPLDYLVVAGGGGGGHEQAYGNNYGGGGGGGAGGYRADTAIGYRQGNYAVTIGAGGAASTGSNNNGSNGAGSNFDTITTVGGGGGGGGNAAGNPGGSGGGGGGSNGGSRAGGVGTAGQGNDGGSSPYWGGTCSSGGGGGGAGGVGTMAKPCATNPGGPGIANALTGTSVVYAAGGAGSPGLGSGTYAGSAGAANTGNGGDGGSYGGAAGAGGSGLVALAYPAIFADLVVGAGLTWAFSQVSRAGYKVYQFTANGGQVTLRSPTTYTGGTHLRNGTVMAGGTDAFGAGPITVWPGATLHRNGLVLPNPIVNNGGTVI